MSRMERLFRRGRLKLYKDLNIMEIIRNQKILITAVNEQMGERLFA